MQIPATLAAEQALTRQNVALSVVKSSAEADQQLANVIEEVAEGAQNASGRGSNVDIYA